MLQVVATKEDVGDQYLLHRGQGHSGEGHQLEVVDGEDGAGELCDNFTTVRLRPSSSWDEGRV
ncbi:hypothetical protein H6P81_013042 [Aristolochia fimbriata]|uniref:Uncharacterized protein n=1 Tax=Aristolochia fimbriata TaxID=158543 RepID=A0AAV7EDX8_ARIFI|nr:hypothetical protein H6P81_013042 [Aristolochia fimbriata]